MAYHVGNTLSNSIKIAHGGVKYLRFLVKCRDLYRFVAGGTVFWQIEAIILLHVD